MKAFLKVICAVCSTAVFAAPQFDHSEILEVTPEMREFLASRDYTSIPSEQRMNTLIRDILSENGLNFQYDTTLTLTASGAYQARSGNCLSFAYLFTALAREVGLKAYFNDAEIPPSFMSQKSLVVETTHVNVAVRYRGEVFIVELIEDYRNRTLLDLNLISDAAAFSLYYNNLGVSAAADGDFQLANSLLSKARSLDSDNPSVSRNLGLLSKVGGDLPSAETYLLEALKNENHPSMIYFILSDLYSEMGERDKADSYSHKAHNLRRKNPFFYYDEAVRDIDLEDWQSALKNLEKAIRLAEKCHFFHYDIALVYERLGELKKAKLSLKDAISFASTEDIQTHYESTLDAVRQVYANRTEENGDFIIHR
jgi:tetratricopeptide (TPR) repeat protein